MNEVKVRVISAYLVTTQCVSNPLDNIGKSAIVYDTVAFATKAEAEKITNRKPSEPVRFVERYAVVFPDGKQMGLQLQEHCHVYKSISEYREACDLDFIG